jgi:hypothetical protein
MIAIRAIADSKAASIHNARADRVKKISAAGVHGFDPAVCKLNYKIPGAQFKLKG